ncbi:hypothetical protein V8E52_009856 [Russula decolorans]
MTVVKRAQVDAQIPLASGAMDSVYVESKTGERCEGVRTEECTKSYLRSKGGVGEGMVPRQFLGICVPFTNNPATEVTLRTCIHEWGSQLLGLDVLIGIPHARQSDIKTLLYTRSSYGREVNWVLQPEAKLHGIGAYTLLQSYFQEGCKTLSGHYCHWKDSEYDKMICEVMKGLQDVEKSLYKQYSTTAGDNAIHPDVVVKESSSHCAGDFIDIVESGLPADFSKKAGKSVAKYSSSEWGIREKAMVRTNRLRTRAAAAGERRCSSGHHQVSVAACTNPDGEVMASCVDCRQRRHNARTAAAVEAEDLAPDVDDALLGPAEGIEDGLAVDNEFGDAQWMMDDGRTELLQSS